MTKHSENTEPSNSTKPVLENRLFKFRVWDLADKEMTSFDKIRILSNETMMYQLFEEERYIWMQFTGLKDKNEKEIYEGDVISIEYVNGIVEYSEKQAMFIINWIGDNEAYNESLAYIPRNYIYGKTRKDIEVIGNIYENPELLQTTS